MIQVHGLSRRYGRLWAVRDLNFQVFRGEVFGLLGSNGAGKSTTIKMLCGLLKPTRGRVIIGGHDMARQALRAKATLGYLPENPALYERLTGQESLEMVGSLRRMEPRVIEQRIAYYAQALGLGRQMRDQVGTYSKGMRQKLAIAMALLHDPPLVILDEPSSGLDPRYTKILKDWIRALSRNGHTVVLSTHVIEMAQSLCDRLAIVDHGRLLALGQAQQIITQTSTTNLEDAFIRLVEGGLEWT